MPTINIFYQNESQKAQLVELIDEIKDHAAAALSCGDILLGPSEVSVRLIYAEGNGMIAGVEIEITAHAFAERIATQDEICHEMRTFMRERLHGTDVRVWLLLPQLGHSWE